MEEEDSWSFKEGVVTRKVLPESKSFFWKIKRWSKPFRHHIVKRITPKLYETALTQEASRNVSTVPRGVTKLMMLLGIDKKKPAGVEIGVCRGINAKSLLECLNPSRLYLIDPYSQYKNENAVLNYEPWMEEMLERVSPWKDRVTFIRKTSEDAAPEIPENLDFVYIDGNHLYPYTLKDLELYYPKVKKGGVIGGHDANIEEVENAFTDFCEKKQIRFIQFDWDFIIKK